LGNLFALKQILREQQQTNLKQTTHNEPQATQLRMCFSRDGLPNSNLIRGVSDLQKVKNTAYHAWVEDALGNIVFDPDFAEDNFVKFCNDCEQDAPKCRYRYEQQEDCVDFCMKSAVGKAVEFASIGFPETYRSGFCNLNCFYYLRKNKGMNYKMVVGASGWVKKNGDLHFEWG